MVNKSSQARYDLLSGCTASRNKVRLVSPRYCRGQVQGACRLLRSSTAMGTGKDNPYPAVSGLVTAKVYTPLHCLQICQSLSRSGSQT